MKTTRLLNKLTLGKNNGNKSASGRNNGNVKVDKFGNNSVKHAKKSEKSKKLSQSGKPKSEKLAKSKKPLKSRNFPNFSIKKMGPTLLTLGTKIVFNYL